MAYDRYGQNDPQRDYNDRAGRDDDGGGRRGGYGARDYQSAGELGGYGRDKQREYSQRDQGSRDQGQRDYGQQDYGQRSYGQRSHGDYAARDYGVGRQTGRQDPGDWGDQDRNRQGFTGGSDYYRGGQDRGNFGRDSHRQSRGTFDRQPQNYGQGGDDRGFIERAGDEVRSWFGDEEAERRREQDARRSEREGGYGRDEHYQSWRDQQVAAFDRDYHEYRQENQAKFHNEFSSWRTERQGQRDLLGQVKEHLEVVGSDGEHVGTVDKVSGDRVILTKSDQDAGGRHHSFPSRWIRSVDDKVTLTKSAAEAKQQWQDEERQNALFGDADRDAQNRQAGTGGVQSDVGTNLNRSFSGTY